MRGGGGGAWGGGRANGGGRGGGGQKARPRPPAPARHIATLARALPRTAGGGVGRFHLRRILVLPLEPPFARGAGPGARVRVARVSCRRRRERGAQSGGPGRHGRGGGVAGPR